MEQYVNEHPGCYIYYSYYDGYRICYGMSCRSSGPNGSDITSLRTSFSVRRCQDPVNVYTYASMYQNGRYHYYYYTFYQSETLDNPGYYYYNRNTSYTAILDRNASHLGFEVNL